MKAESVHLLFKMNMVALNHVASFPWDARHVNANHFDK